jgi:hypothetical protein
MIRSLPEQSVYLAVLAFVLFYRSKRDASEALVGLLPKQLVNRAGLGPHSPNFKLMSQLPGHPHGVVTLKDECLLYRLQLAPRISIAPSSVILP